MAKVDLAGGSRSFVSETLDRVSCKDGFGLMLIWLRGGQSRVGMPLTYLKRGRSLRTVRVTIAEPPVGWNCGGITQTYGITIR